MKKNTKQDFTPRAKDMTFEELAKWMDECAETARSTEGSHTARENKILTEDIKLGYRRIADTLRAYGAIEERKALANSKEGLYEKYIVLDAQTLQPKDGHYICLRIDSRSAREAKCVMKGLLAYAAACLDEGGESATFGRDILRLIANA